MAIKIGGVDPVGIYYNGVPIVKACHNGVDIWSAEEPPAPSIAKVGSPVVYNSGTANFGYNKSLAITPTAGNTLVVVSLLRGSTSTVCDVTATGGTASFSAEVASNSSTCLHISVATNIGSGITAVILDPNVNARGQAWVQEYSGVDTSTPIDVTSVAGTTGSGDPQQLSAITSVTDGALIIAALGNQLNIGATTPGPYGTAVSAAAGSLSGVGWEFEYNNTNGSTAGSHNLVVCSNQAPTAGIHQPQVSAGYSFNSPTGAIALRPAA